MQQRATPEGCRYHTAMLYSRRVNLIKKLQGTRNKLQQKVSLLHFVRHTTSYSISKIGQNRPRRNGPINIFSKWPPFSVFGPINLINKLSVAICFRSNAIFPRLLDRARKKYDALQFQTESVWVQSALCTVSCLLTFVTSCLRLRFASYFTQLYFTTKCYSKKQNRNTT